MPNYLYNGIELPALPEWDKEAYPFCAIVETSTEGEYRLVLLTEEHRINSSNCLWGAFIRPYCIVVDGAWVQQEDSFIIGGYKTVKWVNYDAYYFDYSDWELAGTLYLAASDPVLVGGEPEQQRTVFNFFDMGGSWDDDNGHYENLPDTAFAVGEFPLHISCEKSLDYAERTCQHPSVSLKTGTLFETAKQGDEITITFMFPSLTTNIGMDAFNFLVNCGKQDVGLPRKFDIHYEYATNELEVTTKDLSNIIDLFRFDEAISNAITTPITDNSGAVIGFSVSGVLTSAIEYIHFAPYFYSEDNKQYNVQSTMTFSSYDDLQITLTVPNPEPDTPDPEPPEPVLAWQKHDAYKPNTKWDGNTFYRVMGGKWVKQDSVNPSVVVEDEPTGEPIAYLYNGVQLPDINRVWTDKVTYPYAMITRTITNGSYLLLVCGDMPYYTEQAYNAEEGYHPVVISPGPYKGFAYVAGSWVLSIENTDSGVSNNAGNLELIWTNVDVMNKDNGSVYFDASEPPVPVYA